MSKKAISLTENMSTSHTQSTSSRLISLDALRGFDMFWIVGAEGLVKGLDTISASGITGIAGVTEFLNHQLKHKAWAGFAFEDLIFPLFVFMMGVAMVFSLTKILNSEGRAIAHKRLFRRFVLLFLVGILYCGGLSEVWPDVRLLGVLQRIALCYFFGGLLFLNTKPRTMVFACVSILIGYWALLCFVPVPGIGTGIIEPETNWAYYVDFHYLPGRHFDDTWDPEGLLSTIPAVSSCLLGVFAGLLLKDKSVVDKKKVAYLVGFGIAGVALGFLWGFQFPVIKKIWTSSFVLVSGGYSAILLGLFYLVIDVWKYQKWATPFLWIGTNALTIYLAARIVSFDDLAMRFVGGSVKAAAGAYGDLLVGIVSMTLVLVLANFLFRRKIFLRL